MTQNGIALTETLRTALYNRLGHSTTFDESTPLGELFHLDSLKRLELTALIESNCGVYVNDGMLKEHLTIHELSGLLHDTQVSQVRLHGVRDSNFSVPVRIIRTILQALILPLLRIIYPVTVHGSEHLNELKTPHIFAINHTSHLDTPTVLRALPYRIRKNIAFAAAADVFYSEGKPEVFADRCKRRFFEIVFNIFPFSRELNLRHSINNCIDVIKRGHHVGIYPEGKRTITGELMPFKNGFSIVASKANVPIIPVRIDGLFTILKKGKRIPSFGKVTVTIGAPYIVRSDQSYREITSDIENYFRSF